MKFLQENGVFEAAKSLAFEYMQSAGVTQICRERFVKRYVTGHRDRPCGALINLYKKGHRHGMTTHVDYTAGSGNRCQNPH